MGKGAVNETLPNYGGVYAGSGSNEAVRKMVEESDLVISVGAIKSDFNTAGFTYRISELNTIDFHSQMVKVGFSEYHGLRMNGVLRKVTQRMGKLNVQKISTAPATKPEEMDDSDSQIITHSWFWPHLTKWVKEDDIIVTETGTSGYVSFPRVVSFPYPGFPADNDCTQTGHMGGQVPERRHRYLADSLGKYWVRLWFSARRSTSRKGDREQTRDPVHGRWLIPTDSSGTE